MLSTILKRDFSRFLPIYGVLVVSYAVAFRVVYCGSLQVVAIRVDAWWARRHALDTMHITPKANTRQPVIVEQMTSEFKFPDFMDLFSSSMGQQPPTHRSLTHSLDLSV